MTAQVPRALADAIARNGSIPFDQFVDLALYDDHDGFFASGGGAGRDRGDFITSPEVGPLFGAVVARWIDEQWRAIGEPDPFVVIEAGAGRGALALAVRAAAPACSAAMRYVLVERSTAWRARQGEHLALVHPFEVLGPDGEPDESVPAAVAGSGPVFCSLSDLPLQRVDGVVIANELLDNVAFRLAQRAADSWSELRVGVDDTGPAWIRVPLAPADGVRLDRLAPGTAEGAVVPLQDGAAAWIDRARSALRRGAVLAIDYADTTASLARRPAEEWLRTYRDHERGTDPLSDLGVQDITCEVATDQLPGGFAATTQQAWLARWGIDELVDEGRLRWAERAGVGDLEALRARSRIVEAEALTDPAGLGGFTVMEWRV